MAGRVFALIPAHNEEGVIEAALEGVMSQSYPVEDYIVVLDNCTDHTGILALGKGAGVLATSGNQDKKAGALNQALAFLLQDDGLAEDDMILIQDADTVLDHGFVKAGAAELTEEVGAVGGVFYGETGHGLLGLLQRNEFVRYARQIDRDDGRVRVLSGTATLFRVGTLRVVQAARGGETVYDTKALTEDNEITLFLKTLGYKPISPAGCRVVTEVMPTWRQLWRQRRRWQRGALENLRHYGWTRTTRPYILRQWTAALGASALMLCLLYFVLAVAMGVSVVPGAIGAGVAGVFIVERVITVRKAGLRAMAIAALLVIEIAYDVFLTAVYAASVTGWILRTPTDAW